MIINVTFDVPEDPDLMNAYRAFQNKYGDRIAHILETADFREGMLNHELSINLNDPDLAREFIDIFTKNDKE